MVAVGRQDPGLDPALDPRSVRTAAEQGAAGLLAGEHEHDREPTEMSIAHVLELVEQHRRLAGAVDVHERHTRERLGGEDRRDDRQDRRDPATGRQSGVGARCTGVDPVCEVPERRQGVDRVTDLQLGRRPCREHSTGHASDRDPEWAVGGTRVDRVAATQLDTVELVSQRQVLTVLETQAPVAGVERHHHAVAGVVIDSADEQRGEAVGGRGGRARRAHHRALNNSNGSEQALQT